MKLLTRLMHIYVTQEMYDKIKVLANLNHISLGEIVRDAITEYLGKFEQEQHE